MISPLGSVGTLAYPARACAAEIRRKILKALRLTNQDGFCFSDGFQPATFAHGQSKRRQPNLFGKQNGPDLLRGRQTHLSMSESIAEDNLLSSLILLFSQLFLSFLHLVSFQHGATLCVE